MDENICKHGSNADSTCRFYKEVLQYDKIRRQTTWFKSGINPKVMKVQKPKDEAISKGHCKYYKRIQQK